MNFLKKSAPIDYLMVLRGAAAIGVALGHLAGIGALSIGAVVTKSRFSYVPHAEPFETWRTMVEILTPLVGLNFVILFFVQSGYLMGKVFFEGRYDAVSGKRHFYWARYLRLAPALYVNLVICALFFPGANNNPTMMLGDFLFINNFTGRGINLVTWSLSHEMQYYLIAPFVFLAFRKVSAVRVTGLVALIVAAFLIGQHIDQFGYIFCFLAGFGVNLLPKPAVSPRTKKIGLAIGLLTVHLGFNLLYFYHQNTAAIVLTTLAAAALVYVCEMRSQAEHGSVGFRFGMMTGYLTYGFYLWHYVIIRTLGPYFDSWARAVTSIHWAQTAIYHGLELAIAIPIAYVFAWFSFVFIESTFRPRLYQSGTPGRDIKGALDAAPSFTSHRAASR
jgi:peptidoglycan/LPS O-acetylase OafA/YrhL